MSALRDAISSLEPIEILHRNFGQKRHCLAREDVLALVDKYEQREDKRPVREALGAHLRNFVEYMESDAPTEERFQASFQAAQLTAAAAIVEAIDKGADLIASVLENR